MRNISSEKIDLELPPAKCPPFYLGNNGFKHMHGAITCIDRITKRNIFPLCYILIFCSIAELRCLVSWWLHQIERFPHNWPFVWGIHRSMVNSPHKGQWRGALLFSLICVGINGWVNTSEAGDLRRNRAHYDVIVLSLSFTGAEWPSWSWICCHWLHRGPAWKLPVQLKATANFQCLHVYVINML